MVKRALLLYSGGLDTSVMLKMLQERLGMDVATLTLDVGQEENDLVSIAEKARNLGASDVITRDVKDKFSKDYISREIRADGLYGGVYPLSTTIARPLMASEAVDYAEELDCDVIVHGCTGKGNDQVRFEISIKALNPEMDIIAPIRDWGLNRDVEIKYARENEIPLKQGGKYSTDENLWGRSVEGSGLETPSLQVPDDAYSWVVPPHKVTSDGIQIDLEFENGIPYKIQGVQYELEKIVSELNKIAGLRGIGGIDYIEDRVTGIKSREFYECPAAVTILQAHKALERLTLTREELSMKSILDGRWADLAYNGLWFEPVMGHINLFENSVNEAVSGRATIRLDHGTCTVLGVESDNSLYNFETSTYGEQDTFDQSTAKGFISIYGSQTVNAARVRNKKSGQLVRG